MFFQSCFACGTGHQLDSYVPGSFAGSFAWLALFTPMQHAVFQTSSFAHYEPEFACSPRTKNCMFKPLQSGS